ncbi:MAG: UvrB/UvrC motif-containing protein [Candidatus Omnitrophota bacterium]
MKCNICGLREATVHLTEVIDDEVTKLHLCEECTKTKSAEMQSHFGLTDLLTGLMDLNPAVGEGQETKGILVECPGCGMTYHDFQETGRLGCGKCYVTFKKKLSELLRKINGSDKHTGKMPFRGKKVLKDQEDLQRLKKELNELVQAEDFEKAALIRDRIREMEEKIQN